MRLRNQLFVYGALALALTLFWNAYAAVPQITVYKDPNCGCCSLWVDHLAANGFEVTAHDVANMAEYKREHGVPFSLGSCHTAVVDGYTIEGHVPAADIHRLLQERPDAKGLAVPGMPLGSPGMEAGPHRQAYSVFLFDDAGRTSVYSEYAAR